MGMSMQAGAAAPRASRTSAGKGGAAPMVGGPTNGSVMDKSSWAYTQALQDANAMRGLDGNYNVGGPATQVRDTRNIDRGGVSVDGSGYIRKGIDRYMNPYTDSVINATRQDLMRTNNIMQDQNAADAISAGAFGGSRHGLVEAETNRNTQDIMAQASADLRSRGFDTAAGLSAQDIANQQQTRQFNAGQNFQRQMYNINNDISRKEFNANQAMQGQLSNAGLGLQADMFSAGVPGQRASLLSGLAGQGFNFGRQLNADQAGAGTQMQQLQQAILTGGANQFSEYMNSPYQSLAALSGSLSGNPLQAATTTNQTYNPGKGQTIGAGAQTIGTLKGL